MKICLTELQQSYLLSNSEICNGLNSHAYFEYEILLDVARLKYAINKIIEKHPILKGKIDQNDDLVLDLNLTDFTINTFDFNVLDIEDRIKFLLKNGLNIKGGYLFDINICNVHKPKLSLLFSIILSDLETQKQISKDLIFFYSNDNHKFASNISLYEKNNFSIREIKKTDMYLKSKFFWEEQLKTLPSFPFINNFKYDLKKTNEIRRRSDVVSVKDIAILAEICNKNKVSISSFIYTVYAEILSRKFNDKQFCISLLFDKRKVYGIEKDTIGNYSDIIVLEFDFSKEELFFDKVRANQKQFWLKMTNCFYSGVEIIKNINSRSKIKNNNTIPFLMSINSDFKNLNEANFEGNNVVTTWILRPQVCLDFQVNENSQGIEIVLYYQSALFLETFIDDILINFKEKLLKK